VPYGPQCGDCVLRFAGILNGGQVSPPEGERGTL